MSPYLLWDMRKLAPQDRNGVDRARIMVILGVDPGTNATGYGIIVKNGSRASHVKSGVIRPSRPGSLSRRLWEVHAGLDVVIREHEPSIMVVESLFHGHNSQSFMKLSQVRGVILLLGETYGMEIFEYAPAEIKMGLTGYGRADKSQMVYMISHILNLPKLRSTDEADALAMAVYHSNRCGFSRMVS